MWYLRRLFISYIIYKSRSFFPAIKAMMPHMRKKKKKKPSKNLPLSQLKIEKLYSTTTFKTLFCSFFNKKKTNRLKYTAKACNTPKTKTCDTKIEKKKKKNP